jgi:hypothetical protein
MRVDCQDKPESLLKLNAQFQELTLASLLSDQAARMFWPLLLEDTWTSCWAVPHGEMEEFSLAKLIDGSNAQNPNTSLRMNPAKQDPIVESEFLNGLFKFRNFIGSKYK